MENSGLYFFLILSFVTAGSKWRKGNFSDRRDYAGEKFVPAMKSVIFFFIIEEINNVTVINQVEHYALKCLEEMYLEICSQTCFFTY